jgi:hypothetical protein
VAEADDHLLRLDPPADVRFGFLGAAVTLLTKANSLAPPCFGRSSADRARQE